ncbi:MAG: asparagine synthase (glutamine-hydrolyzing) [Planctomycetota bacterium]|nr:MAG: asparagine synthase (glutamine-hydrolyzing) [Planctomycetota bacterium]
MCGLAGILRVHRPGCPPLPHQKSISEACLDILDDSIKHRGPDGAGRIRDRAIRPDGTVVDVALVHRRLSIIDLAGGWQPMVHVRQADGTGSLLRPDPRPVQQFPTIDATSLDPETDLIAVVFNGCIYNHRELRSELESLGHRFETDHSDTEVLVHGWRAWGPALQDHLDGMYAFLIWSRQEGRLAWGRDLVGEKPLYRSVAEDTCVLASTVPALVRCNRALGLPDIAPDEHRIEAWIRSGAGPVPLTRCHGIDPGSTHVAPVERQTGARDGHSSRRRTAATCARSIKLPDRAGHAKPDAARIALQLESAVRSRLDADVPLGVFLSGGLDSALIAAIAHKSRPDLRAFTVRMGHPAYDESDAAATTAAAIGIEHTMLDCQPTPAEDLIHLIEQLGQPFGDSSLLPTYWISRAAREHIKVALSGDGGDELFGGYRRHVINLPLNRWHTLLRLVPDILLDRRSPTSRSAYLARLAVAARHCGYEELLSIFPTPDLRRLLATAGAPPRASQPFTRIDDPLRYDFLSYLPDDLLCKTDTASMAVGLEVRAPLLARDLVETALRTPIEVLMPNGQRKGLLKQIARSYLPEQIIERPKRGFAIPIGQWFRTDFGSMRQVLFDHLESTDPFPGLAEAGVEINLRFVRKMLHEHDAAGQESLNPWRGRDHSQRLYLLLVLSIWTKWLARVRREHHDNPPPNPLPPSGTTLAKPQ